MESRLPRFGLVVVIALVALRLTVGWHFFKEGAKKFTGGEFSSNRFLQAAKGPLAPSFHALIPDYKGHRRLSRDRILTSWIAHRKIVAGQLGFDDAQNAQADEILAEYKKQLSRFFYAYQEDIKEYFLEWERLEQARAEPEADGLRFRQQWINEQQSRLFARPAGWYAELEMLSGQFEQSLLDVAGSDRAVASVSPIPDPSSSWVDAMVKYSVLGIGILMILGLLTRLACIAGAGFLATVLTSQPFWVHGAQLDYSYYQAVELVACLFLAAIGAGRIAGLDFFLQPMWARCCSKKKP